MGNPLGIQIPEVLPERQQQEAPDTKKNLFAKILSDPRIMQFLLSFGANLSQPRQFGTSELQGFSQGVLSGFEGLELQRAAQVARQQQEEEARRQSILDRNAAIVQQVDVERTRGQTEGEAATTEETLLGNEATARDQPNVEAQSNLAVQQSRQDLTAGAEDIRKTKQDVVKSEKDVERIDAEIFDLEQKQRDTELKRQEAERRAPGQDEAQMLNAQANMLRAKAERARLEKANVGDLTSAGGRVAEEVKNFLARSQPRATAVDFPGMEDIAGIGVFVDTTRKVNDLAGSLGARAIINQGLGLDPRELQQLAGYVGGIRNTGQQENGKPVFISNRSISGKPNPSGGWTEASIPTVDGRNQPAMRLETEGGIIYILLASIESNIEANQ